MSTENSCSKIRLITRITALACLTGMLLCKKLWLAERAFPLSPVFKFLPELPHPFDFILFGLTIFMLLCIIFLDNAQKVIIGFLIASVILSLLDQNRWQPWFYQYILMFFVLSIYNYKENEIQKQKAIISIFKLMIGAIYFWSGLQKLNPNFLTDTFPWLMEPVNNYLGLSNNNHFKFLGCIFPIIEMATGITLFIKPIQKSAIIIVLLMHLFILFSLGPFGHNYNPVVWPWNIAMMCFCIILFYNEELIGLTDIRNMLRFHSLKIVTALFIMMPLFNFFNLWDSYLSQNLYSGNTSNGIIYVSDSVRSNLPNDVKPYAVGNLNQNKILIKYWCMMELGVPAYPEKRNFVAISNAFYQYTKDSDQVYLMYTPKLRLEDLNQ